MRLRTRHDWARTRFTQFFCSQKAKTPVERHTLCTYEYFEYRDQPRASESTGWPTEKVLFRFLSITFNRPKLEIYIFFFWKKQHFSCTCKNSIKQIFIIKTKKWVTLEIFCLDGKIFLSNWTIIWVLKFSDYKAFIQRKVCH